MPKNKFYKNYCQFDLVVGYESMLEELKNASAETKELFEKVWESFEKNEFSYDGATFVRERFSDTIFEVAAFIHDYENSFGNVGSKADLKFLKIMHELEYPNKIILERYRWMHWTWINVLRHKILKFIKRWKR